MYKKQHPRTMKKFHPLFILVLLVLVACSKKAQSIQLTTPPPATQTIIPYTPTILTPTADPTIFGTIGTSEIQAYALESVANAIFNKTMDSFVAHGRIQEYQVTRVSLFPGSNGLISEIIFNVRTTDPGWIAEGGTPAPQDWLIGQCLRFDFFTTETEYQLKNRRLCS